MADRKMLAVQEPAYNRLAEAKREWEQMLGRVLTWSDFLVIAVRRP